MADRRPQRLAALIESLRGLHLDGLLLTNLSNVRYLTGFSGSNALVFVSTREDVLLITDFRYQTQVTTEVGDFAHVEIETSNLWARLWQQLPSMPGVELAGFESQHLVHHDFERLLDGGKRWSWRPTMDVVESLREKKDPEEVARIAVAAGIATRALERTLPAVRAGMSELQVAAVLESSLREEGSEEYPFPSIVASGERSALPHARTSSRQVGRGDFLLLDFGASYAGYCADVTRTVVVGPADNDQRAVYAIVRAANERSAEQVRAGMRGKDADAIAREYIEAQGFGEAFGHSLGHGIGLEVHEAPRLSKTAEGVLAVDSVVTIEPGIYRPGWGGVRIEDDVHLNANGSDLLTHFSHELIELD